MEKVDRILEKQNNLESKRAVWENHWREVGERVRPEYNQFNIMRTEGDKRNERIFDSTAPLALPKFMAACASMVIPSTQRYQALTVSDNQLAKRSDVKKYLEEVTNILFKVRYAPAGNFQSQTGECIMDYGAFGTGVLFIDDLLGQGIRYKSLALSQCYVAEDQYGTIDTLHRKFQWTAKQAVTMFGLDKVSDGIRGAYERNSQDKFWFLHSVSPNPDKEEGRMDWTGMNYYSCYVELDQRKLLDEGGFRVFPFAVPRFETAPDETYGRSPAMKVLPDIKMVNEMMKTTIRAAHMVTSPPIMLSDDASLQAFNMRPNALNYGSIDDQGRARAMPFNTGGRVDLGLEMMNQCREVINDAFFVTLFRILVDEPRITATEAMLRAQEKGQLLAPPLGRLQSELIGPITNREIDILSAAGALPEMPEALLEAGAEVEIQYQSPLNLAQKASSGVAILNTLNGLAPLAQIDQNILKRFNMDASAKLLAEANGYPEEGMYSDEDMEARNEQEQQAEQAQQLLAAAPVAASAAKDLSQAQALANQSQAPAIIPEGA